MKINLTEEQLLNVLNKCYAAALDGIPKTKTCYDLASEYLSKYGSKEKAVKNFVKWQTAKCTTSGFLTSLGGIVTLPIAIPANLATVWYVQLRMIATIANIAGYDPSDDEVQSLAYICLTGSSVSKIFRETGVELGNKLTVAAIEKIPTKALQKINHTVGKRMITKFGTTGVINLEKMIPFVGGIVGGSFDYVGTRIIAKKTQDVFLLRKID